MAKHGRTHRAASIALSILLAGAAAGCGLIGNGAPARTADGAVAGSGEVDPLDLRVGDCFDNPNTDRVEKVLVLPCEELHDFEIYHAFDLEDGPYPGDEEMEQLWVSGCLAEFEGFVGTSFDESVLDISAVFPTQQTWDELGDREVLCSVTEVSGQARRGTAEGSEV